MKKHGPSSKCESITVPWVLILSFGLGEIQREELQLLPEEHLQKRWSSQHAFCLSALIRTGKM